MSDEAARRREARRRRILENPEGRINKIIGVDSAKSIETEVSTVNKQEQPLPSDVTNRNEDINKFEEILKETLPKSAETEELKRKPLPSFVAHKRKRSEDLTEETAPAEVFNPDPVFSPVIPLRESSESLQRSKPPLPTLYGLIPIIALGVFVYLMILLGLQGLFLNTIFVPFLSIEIARIATQRYYYPNGLTNNNFISAALVLSGIRKEVAATICDVLTILQTVVTDLAFYIFTFLCCQSLFGIV